MGEFSRDEIMSMRNKTSSTYQSRTLIDRDVLMSRELLTLC